MSKLLQFFRRKCCCTKTKKTPNSVPNECRELQLYQPCPGFLRWPHQLTETPARVFITAPQGRTITMPLRHFSSVQMLKENTIEAFVLLNVLPQFAVSVAKLARQYVLVAVRCGRRLDERDSLGALGVRDNGERRI